METEIAITKKQRDISLDICRGLCLFLVIVGHNTLYADNLLQEWIHSFHMPLMFILSGYFFKTDKPFKETLKHSAKRLLIPYAVAYIITEVYQIIEAAITHERTVTRVLDLAVKRVINYDRWVSWFLIALFWAQIFAWLCDKNKKWGWVIALVSGTAAYYIFGFTRGAPFNAMMGLLVLPWVYLGILCRRCKWLDAIKTWKTKYLLILCTVCMGITAVFPTMYDLHNGCESLAQVLVAIGMSICVYRLCVFISGFRISKCLEFIGRDTIPIYVMHIIENVVTGFSACIVIEHFVEPTTAIRLIVQIVCSLATIVVYSLLTILWRKITKRRK